MMEKRSWGSYSILDEGKTYKIKKIIVKPGHHLSFQLHYYRSEHWVVVSGMAEVKLNGESEFIRKGESIYVPIGTKHRLKNPGIIPLEVIEVEIGEYLQEDDIIRFENSENLID